LADSVRAFREAGAEEEAAIALSALGEKEQALAIVREALADPGSATPGLYCTLGDLTGDEEHFRSALQLAGGRHFRAALALGASATRRRAWAEAEEHLKIALLLRPHSAPVWLHLAMCMMQAEPPRESEAVDALRRALSLEPDDVQSWALLGSTLLEMPGREAEARSALGRASELLPTDPTLAGRHVRACCATNDLENAKKTIGRAHALGLTLPKSAIHRVYQALGGSGDGERSASATLSGSGALSADAQKLATAAALASERRLDNGDGADTLGMASFFYQVVDNVAAEAKCRAARLELLLKARKWEKNASALQEFVEEAAQLLQVHERMGAPRDKLIAMRLILHGVAERTSDAFCATAGFEELRMLINSVERHVGTGSDGDSD